MVLLKKKGISGSFQKLKVKMIIVSFFLKRNLGYGSFYNDRRIWVIEVFYNDIEVFIL